MQEWLAGALVTQARSAVLVSHDVEEALYLCDRVLVLSSRPAVVVAELAAPSPRALPRNQVVADPAFVALRERALWALQERRR
jgi:ABC-type nitrate/sulfonate/bicarbonate transport system ATPase subunit